MKNNYFFLFLSVLTDLMFDCIKKVNYIRPFWSALKNNINPMYGEHKLNYRKSIYTNGPKETITLNYA